MKIWAIVWIIIGFINFYDLIHRKELRLFQEYVESFYEVES
jgi:hypothetical protein